MELEDFYTGEKKDIEIPKGCIIIEKNIDEANQFFCNENFAFWNAYMDIIFVDFFPNKPKSVTDIPLYKSDKEGCFMVIVKEDKYKEWIKQLMRKKRNEKKSAKYIERQWAIYNKKCDLRSEGDTYRKNSQLEQAIASYNLSLQVD